MLQGKAGQVSDAGVGVANTQWKQEKNEPNREWPEGNSLHVREKEERRGEAVDVYFQLFFSPPFPPLSTK